MPDHELRRFLSAHPGHPLGRGMPMGKTLREDGESHHEAWKRLLRLDPCAYCGCRGAGSIDHIEPKNPLKPCRGVGTKFVWTNLAGACERCNAAKRDFPLLVFLRSRQRSIVPLPTKEQSDAGISHSGAGAGGDRRVLRDSAAA